MDIESLIWISSNWDLTPHDVESLSLDSAIYKDFASEVLADLGITDPDPNLFTLIRTDLEGDGIDEVIVGAERITGSLISPAPGDYSILFLRKIIDGEVIQQLIVGDVHASETFGMLNFYRLIAVADLFGLIGAIWVTTSLLDFSAAEFMKGLRLYFEPMDYWFGIIKGFFFGVAITSIACFYGFNAKGGAKGVGETTTTTVVVSCMTIVFLDYILGEIILL